MEGNLNVGSNLNPHINRKQNKQLWQTLTPTRQHHFQGCSLTLKTGNSTGCHSRLLCPLAFECVRQQLYPSICTGQTPLSDPPPEPGSQALDKRPSIHYRYHPPHHPLHSNKQHETGPKCLRAASSLQHTSVLSPLTSCSPILTSVTTYCVPSFLDSASLTYKLRRICLAILTLKHPFA